MLDRNTGTRVPWLRLSALAVCVGFLAALGPVLWIALKAGASIVSLCVLAALGWLGLQALPYWGRRLEQRLLRARFGDARDNPIEELLSQLMERSAQLERYRAVLASIAAQIEGMREMLAQRLAAAPQHDTQKQAAALHKMQTFHTHHLSQLANAEAALVDYKRHLNTKRFEWSFAQAGRSVLDSLRATDRESILRELLSDEASRAVQLNFDQVFASLETELHQIELQGATRARQLPRTPGELG